MCELVPCVRAMSMAKKYIAQSQTHDFEKEQPAAAAAHTKKSINDSKHELLWKQQRPKMNCLPSVVFAMNLLLNISLFSICKIFKATVEAMNGVVN